MEGASFEHLAKLKISVTAADVEFQESSFVLFKADIPATFSTLGNLVEERFSELKTPNKAWKYFWIDEDGDEIPIAHDGEYRGYLNSFDTTSAVPRIHVRVSEQPAEKTFKRTEESTAPKRNDRPVHDRVLCDVCDATIVGHRYKCMTCDNYDLCMRCEANYRHKEHIMVRLPTPDIHDGHRVYRIFEKLRSLVCKMTPLKIVGNETVECEPNDQGAQATDERAASNDEKRPASKRPPQSKRSTETGSAGRETKGSKTEKPPSSSTKKREAKVEDRERNREQRSSGHAQSAEPPLLTDVGATLALVHSLLSRDAPEALNLESSLNDPIVTPPCVPFIPLPSNGPFADFPNPTNATASHVERCNCDPTDPFAACTINQYPKGYYPPGFFNPVPPQGFANMKYSPPLLYPPFYGGNANYAPGYEPYLREGYQDSALPYGLAPRAECPVNVRAQDTALPYGLAPRAECPANVRAQRPGWETSPRPEHPAFASPRLRTQRPGSKTPPRPEHDPARIRVQRSDSQKPPRPQHPVFAPARNSRSDSVPESGTGGRMYAPPFNIPVFLKNTEQSVQHLAEAFSKVIDPLGFGIHQKAARTASTKAAPTTPTDSEPPTPLKPAQTQTPVEAMQDKTTETTVTSSSTVHIQTVPEQKQQQKELVSVAEEAVPSVSGTAKPPPSDVGGDETDEDSVGSWDNIDGQEAGHGDETYECEALGKSSESVQAAKQMADSEGLKKDSTKKHATLEDVLDDDEKVATTAKPPNNPDPSHIYSARPHVNHAIHTMMTMGFSNDDGWLTRLLETLNGDVPKALDMLLQQTPRS
ncbi:protein ref(2)P [Anopheles bellator]|uniref:protein ref(2)P n=1 Tax=Anopheles bellator TaxID=139047 RepID=UPI002648EAC0|nr:protein ref(2)P [Anopheles bellator]XP_058057650.1 protein ref(2)P [Anopheles bellator]